MKNGVLSQNGDLLNIFSLAYVCIKVFPQTLERLFLIWQIRINKTSRFTQTSAVKYKDTRHAQNTTSTDAAKSFICKTRLGSLTLLLDKSFGEILV